MQGNISLSLRLGVQVQCRLEDNSNSKAEPLPVSHQTTENNEAIIMPKGKKNSKGLSRSNFGWATLQKLVRMSMSTNTFVTILSKTVPTFFTQHIKVKVQRGKVPPPFCLIQTLYQISTVKVFPCLTTYSETT
jgi:hypothetical protein